jgi:hypothetical protein
MLLQHLSEEDVKVVIPLTNSDEALHSADEALLLDILSRVEARSGRNTPVPDDMLDQFAISTSEDGVQVEPITDGAVETLIRDVPPDPDSPSTLAVVLTFSCIASLLLLSCVGIVLYAATVIRDGLFRSRTAWELLSYLEKRENRSEVIERRDPKDRVAYCEKMMIMDGGVEDREGLQLQREEHQSGTLSENPSPEDLDEKFYDCQCESNDSSAYSTPFMSTTPLVDVSRQTTPTPPPLELPPSYPADHPVRPQWSVRASESKLPQVTVTSPVSSKVTNSLPSSTPESTTAATLERDRRRAFTAIPELDAALAMQLRPGLGLGAMVDAAWLVRFVMALFGWCAVLMTGKRERHYA